MGIRFKWDMYITSFIPLWISIIFSIGWDIIEVGRGIWGQEEGLKQNLEKVIKKNVIQLGFILIIIFVMIMSTNNIKKFLKDKASMENKSQAMIFNAKKANKLTSDFLLAYILPMIAFDFFVLKDIMIFVIYFVVLSILCIRNNNVYVNIFLELQRYKMYECDIECNVMGRKERYCNSLVISKLDITLPTNSEIEYWDFNNDIYIDLRSVKN